MNRNQVTHYLMLVLGISLCLSTQLFCEDTTESSDKKSEPQTEKNDEISVKAERPTWRDYWAKQKKEKQDYRVYFTKGVMNELDKEYGKAIRNFNKAIKFKSDCGPAFFHRGYCFFQKGKVSEAIKSYLTAINLQPELKGANYHLGLAYLRQYRIADAKSQLEKLKTLDSSLAEQLERSISEKEKNL